MLDTFYEELDDAFIDEKESAHDFIWGQLKKLCRDAKMGKLQKSCVVNTIKDGKQQQETLKLRGLELIEVPSNPAWIPEKLEASDLKYFEHSVTDKTMEYLKLYASFSVLRHDKYGDSLVEDQKKKVAELMLNKADQKIIDDAKKTMEDTQENFKKGRPECIEQILYTALYQPISQKVLANVDRELDKENEELYPKEKPSTTKA